MNVEELDRLFQRLRTIISLKPEWFKMILDFGGTTAVSVHEDDNLSTIYA